MNKDEELYPLLAVFVQPLLIAADAHLPMLIPILERGRGPNLLRFPEERRRDLSAPLAVRQPRAV